MSLIWNNNISVSYFGESHDNMLGITLSGFPAGEYIDCDEICKFLRRLFPKSMGYSSSFPTPRIVSGLSHYRTTGAPICAMFQNTERRDDLPEVPQDIRKGHGDYTGTLRYRGFSDVKRDTELHKRFIQPICFAGAVCAQILERRGIYTGAHIAMIHNLKDNPYDPVNISRDGVMSIRFKDFPVINDRRGWDMLEDIKLAKEYGETLGGIVECAAVNVPCGAGSPLFNGLQNKIAQLIFAIPCVSGIEFGAGFNAASMVGSQYSDSFYTDDRGHCVTRTNSHGGIIGGISTGMPITLNVSFTPPPADSGETCIVPGAAVCVEAAVDLALLSCMIDYPNFC